jgi:sugar phosphate isomerase/epimerase
MKLGINSVLFGGHSLDDAFRSAQMCGYDGIELSAIDGMSEHLVLDAGRWRELVPQIKQLSKQYNLPLLAMEQPSQDAAKMEAAFQAAAELSIPIVNCGPGGKANDESTLQSVVDSLGKLAERAKQHGVTLCFKAHVGQYVYNTATTLKVLSAVNHPNLGLDMDPSHIWRAGESPVDAIAAVARHIRHVHIRDCKGREQNPGPPELQANGRGDIDLLGYLRVLHASGYAGPVDLEIIGAKDYDVPRCIAIAAEARGHMQACLQACRAR